MKVTNKSQAARGVHFGGALRWIKPGESAEGEMTPTERARAENIDGVLLDGDATLPEPAGKADEVADLKAQVADLTAQVSDLTSKLAAATKK